MLRNLQGPELIIIVLLIVVVFGWKRLPDAARSLGRSARVFKSEVEEMRKEDSDKASGGAIEASKKSDKGGKGDDSETEASPVQEKQAKNDGPIS